MINGGHSALAEDNKKPASDESPEEQVRRAEGPKPDRRIDLFQKDMNRKKKEETQNLREKS
jgi:hypothetical protein